MPPIQAPRTPHDSFAPIDFGHASNEGLSGFESSYRLLNGYTEKLGEGSKTPTPVYACPGTSRFDVNTPFTTGKCRGMLYVGGVGLVVVCGNSVAIFDANGNGSAVNGTVAGNDMVFMAENDANPPQIGIVCNQQYYVLQPAYSGTSATLPPPNTVTLQNNANLPAPNSIAAVDGYLVFSIPNGQIFHTNLNDALTINALAFGSMAKAPYQARRVVNFRNKLVALGERSVEVFDDIGTIPFAFSLNSTSWDVGCLSAYAVAQVGDAAASLLWVDMSGRVMQYTQYAPQVVSNPAVERAIAGLTTFQKSLLYATSTHHAGHDFFALTSIYWTWELDLSTGLWHERQSNNVPNWFAQGWENYSGLRIVGSNQDFTLHRIDPTQYTENNGNPYPFLMQSEAVTAFPRGLIFDEIRVDTIPGAGITNPQTTPVGVDEANPQLQLTWSDDGGQVWAPPRQCALGLPGKRQTSVSFYQMGACRRGGRVLRLSCASTVMRGVFLVAGRMREYEV